MDLRALADQFHLVFSGLFFVFGLLWGSFVNVVIARLPAELSVVRPRSRCPVCGAPIRWYHNVPVLSYLLLAGRCADCRAPISVRYPLVELICGVLCWTLFARYGLAWELVTLLPFCLALVALTFIDLDHFYLPDVITLPGLGLALALSPLPGGPSWQSSLLGAALGGGLLAAVLLGFRALTGREGMGWGDVKLLAMIGAALGAWALPAVLLLGSLQGILIGGLWLRFGRPPAAGDDQTARSGLRPDGLEPDRGPATAADPRAAQDASPGEFQAAAPQGAPASIAPEIPANAVPFGPFLALGAIEWIYLQERLLGLFWAVQEQLLALAGGGR